jgi:predicted nucleic acid-binding Zn ribbon protein
VCLATAHMPNSKPTAASVQSQIDTHEAVCAERWKETILRIKRIETIMIGTAGTTIVLLVGVLLGQ